MSSTDANLTVAIDIGGTFTDVALHEASTGRVWRAKTPSTPADPSVGFMEGLRAALAAAGAEPSRIGRVLHGTTVATNMILEDSGARTALVTTEGFRHILTIGRQDIPRRANLYSWVKPPRPVPAARVFEVRERIAAGGAVLTALDEDTVLSAAEACRAADVAAVAVCLLHSFANPAHEERVASLLRDLLPGVHVTASTAILPVIREFERSVATVLNATVMPGVATYVARLEERLREAGVPGRLRLMQSNGGIASVPTIRRAPALTALSGPAAGVVGARDATAMAGIGDLITVDIGGTSADICLIKNGRIGLTEKGQVGTWPLPLPMVDMVTIGAGGGSLARINEGALHVGPASAGADPGPACYGRGGGGATVTDAHVALGFLPARLLGGRMALDVAAAREAIERTVATPLGLTLEEAAHGILAIADHRMVGAVRVVSVERGHDPRDFTLVPFGGAGPLHACALADLLGIERILVPASPGVLCAEGLLAAPVRAEFSRSLADGGSFTAAEIAAGFASLVVEGEAWLDGEEVPTHERDRAAVALMRYRGQGSELAVPWDESWDTTATAEAFARHHEALYGFRLDALVELVTLRLEVAGSGGRSTTPPLPPSAAPEPTGTAQASFPGGTVDCPIFSRASLGAGARFSGPAIVEQLDATTLVRPGWEVTVDPSGAMLLHRVRE